jgi:hypothetical protein
LPELNKVATELVGTPLRFLAVSLESDTRRVRVAMEKLKLTLPIATAESELLGPLGLDSVPATLFIDATGRVVARINGIGSKAELKAHAERLIPAATASRWP